MKKQNAYNLCRRYMDMYGLYDYKLLIKKLNGRKSYVKGQIRLGSALEYIKTIVINSDCLSFMTPKYMKQLILHEITHVLNDNYCHGNEFKQVALAIGCVENGKTMVTS